MKITKGIFTTIFSVAALCSYAIEQPDTVVDLSHSGFVKEWARTNRLVVNNLKGYISLGPHTALGPLGSFVGYNTLERLRLGVGGKAYNLAEGHLSFGANLAYGFGDHKWKYGAEGGWAFTSFRPGHGWWRESMLKASYSYSADPLATNSLSLYKPGFRLGISLRHNELFLYRRKASIGYAYEPNKISKLELQFGREAFLPTRFLPLGGMRSLDAWSAELTASWTPGEKFFQDRYVRISTTPYRLHTKARLQWIKGINSAAYTDIMIAEIILGKVTPLGEGPFTIDGLLHSSYSFGHAPYPFLPSLPVSPFILRVFGTFALLKPLELPADRFVDLHLRFNDGGWLLGKVPYIDILNVSLTASLNAAAGDLSHKNDPPQNSHYIPFPYTPTRMLSWQHPYAEAAVGLNNILGMGRIELVRRLSYLHNQDTRKIGLSLGLDITF